MSFVSYAQNFEDVILWRALKHVEKGFYIDIGAQHPVVDSVSFAFYERGWRGVHIEPTQQYADLLRTARPDESVFQLAIGNQSQKLTFFEFEDTGLSTADADVASQHKAHGFKCRESLVPVLSLDALIQQVGTRDIHWLKVDVEGLEKDVLESWQCAFNLPWVVVVESTRPMSQEKSHEEWESLLLVKGYSYTYFDGLNRFYVSQEHPELLEYFGVPPNVFDGFVLGGVASHSFCSLVNSRVEQSKIEAQQAEARANQAEARADQAEARVDQAEARANEAEAKASEAEAKANEAEAKAVEAEAKAVEAEAKACEAANHLELVLKSTSWKITAPLRKLMHTLRWFKNGSMAWLLFKPQSRPRRVTKSALLKLKSFAVRSPKLKKLVLTMLKPFPSLSSRLRRVGQANFHVAQYTMPQTQQDLSPRAKQIYVQLKQAIEQNKKDLV